MCAVAINISQFFIVNGTGAVASTVVGHLKTCSIVILGWIASGKSVSDRSLLGILMAIGGIISLVNLSLDGQTFSRRRKRMSS